MWIAAGELADVTSIAAGGAGAEGCHRRSVTINDIGNTTAAYIGANSVVDADGSVVVAASDGMDMLLVAGVLGGAGTAAIGVSNTTVVTNNTVESYIGDAQVTARGRQAVSLSLPLKGREREPDHGKPDGTCSHGDLL
jgi:hypothetical protein